MNLENLVDTFLEEKTKLGLQQSTIEQYTMYLNKLRNKFGTRDVDDISKENLVGFIMSENFLSYSGKRNGLTIRYHALTIIKSFLKRFDKEHLLKDVKLPMYKRVEVRPVDLNWLKTKVGTSDLKWKMILTTITSSGLRASEFLNLRVKNIDFSMNRVTIKGKGQRDYETPDIVPLSTQAITFIKSWIETNSLTKNDKLLNMKYWQFWNDFKTTLKITPHQLRHTFCTTISKTLTPTEVQTLARHKSFETTRRYINPEREKVLLEYKKKEVTI